tara:strand:+ start:14215 stop:15330 length:1116 start_codon:yes stop_codon:yes gene_type:complete
MHFKKDKSKFQLKSPMRSAFKMMGSKTPLDKVPGLTYADNYELSPTSGQGASSTGYTNEPSPTTTIQYNIGKKSRQGDREFTSKYLNESYGGTNHNQIPYGPDNPADLSHLIRTNFPRNKNGKLTREGRKQQKAHLNYIKNLSENPRRMDLKENRMIPQLTAYQAKKGYTQVQDPNGAYHLLLANGQLAASGNRGYSRESINWRNGFKENPVIGPPADDTTTSKSDNREPVKNASITTGETGGSTVTNTDTGDVVQDDAKFDKDGNLISGKLSDEDQSQGLAAIPFEGLEVDSPQGLPPQPEREVVEETPGGDTTDAEEEEEEVANNEYIPQSQRNNVEKVVDEVEENEVIVEEDDDDDDDEYIPQSRRRS